MTLFCPLYSDHFTRVQAVAILSPKEGSGGSKKGIRKTWKRDIYKGVVIN